MKRTLKRESKVLEIAEIEGMASSIGRGIFGQAFRFDRFAIGLVVFAGRFAAGTRTRPVLGPRSGWISGGREWSREGGCLLGGRSYRPGQIDCWRLRCENPHPIFGVGGSVRWSAGAGELQCLASVVGRQSTVSLLVRFGILTKWLSFTRLETRTKESYIYASDRVGNSFAE